MRRIATKKSPNKKPSMGKTSGTVKSHNLGKTKKARVTVKPINEPKVK